MIQVFSYLFLQQYWWVIISLLASLLVFLMFVQGGQSMIYTLPGSKLQKTMIINAMGRKWEFTFTTLVTFGGAFFASFPLFYATSFGGAYWLWMLILLTFTIQAIAYEYRSKPGNIFGQGTFDMFLFVNGSFGPFLIGVAVATFFTGSQFTLNPYNQVQWGSSWHGLEAFCNLRNLALGFAVLFLARINGLLYILNTIDDEALTEKTARRLIMNAIPFMIFFLLFTVTLLLSEGLSAGENGSITPWKYKYLNNFISMPLVLILFLTGTAGVLYGIAISAMKRSRRGIWFSGTGTLLVVFSLFLVAGFNDTSFYPSVVDHRSSLTITNASSSFFTLKTMTYVSFVIPFIVGYIWYAWKAINIKMIDKEEMDSDTHKY